MVLSAHKQTVWVSEIWAESLSGRHDYLLFYNTDYFWQLHSISPEVEQSQSCWKYEILQNIISKICVNHQHKHDTELFFSLRYVLVNL